MHRVNAATIATILSSQIQHFESSGMIDIRCEKVTGERVKPVGTCTYVSSHEQELLSLTCKTAQMR